MEVEGDQHQRYVDAWLAARASPRTAAHEAELLVAALAVVGAHGRAVLGDVMLEAIRVRILARAQRPYPWLAVFNAPMMAPTDARATIASAASADEIHAGSRLVVAELLRVLSHLTGGVLTARLCEKLDAVGTELAAASEVRERSKPILLQPKATTKRGGMT